MVTNIAGRLARLERYYGGTCGTCHGYPVRIACLNEDGTETGSNLPEDGCPTCGRPVMSELEIVGMTLDELP